MSHISQNTAPAAHNQRPIEDVLDFCVELSRRMISCGANIERVSLAVERICKTYALTDASLFLLSTNIMLSARDSSGFYASRQLTIPPAAINLTKLSSLNRLCYTFLRITLSHFSVSLPGRTSPVIRLSMTFSSLPPF